MFADSVAGPPAQQCAGWLGEPEPGTAAWDEADLNNQACAVEGLRVMQDNPAVAAAVEANEAAGEGDFGSDPFRAPHRWAGERGSYELTTYTDREGNEWPAALFAPPRADDGPHPGVLLACHACFPLPQTTEQVGHLVLGRRGAGGGRLRGALRHDRRQQPLSGRRRRRLPRLHPRRHPTAPGEFNPWHDLVDRGRLGIVGHSGAAGVALEVGNTDERFDAIVAWDPAELRLARRHRRRPRPP